MRNFLFIRLVYLYFYLVDTLQRIPILTLVKYFIFFFSFLLDFPQSNLTKIMIQGASYKIEFECLLI